MIGEIIPESCIHLCEEPHFYSTGLSGSLLPYVSKIRRNRHHGGVSLFRRPALRLELRPVPPQTERDSSRRQDMMKIPRIGLFLVLVAMSAAAQQAAIRENTSCCRRAAPARWRKS